MSMFTQIDTVKRYRLGTRKKDVAGNEYVYLKGVGSTVAYDWVCFDELGVTTRMLAATIGQVGIAQAAIDATTKFGWYLIYGSGSGKALTLYADNAVVKATATAGNVDDPDLVDAENMVFGAWGRSAVVEATNIATFQLSYPYKSAATLD